MTQVRRIRRTDDSAPDPSCDVIRAFTDAIRVAHDPSRVPDVDEACAALLRPLLEAGWWEMAIMLAWPGKFLPFAPFHHEAIAWWADIAAGIEPRPLVACWPRDTGKSTIVGACLAMAVALELRPYMMWISDVEDQVTDKVTTVGVLLQAPRMRMAFPAAAEPWRDPSTGTKVDWRQGRIRTSVGVTLDAGGIDQAMRGRLVILDRPGIIVLDDIEDGTETPYMRKKKERQVTEKILPMGSDDVAVCYVQNRQNKDSLMSQQLDGRAKWLMNRFVSGPWPQIRDLVTEVERQPDGSSRIVIVGGELVWPEGRGYTVSENQLTRMGPAAFRTEHQHEGIASEGHYFARDMWRRAGPGVYPSDRVKIARGWDFAATAGAGDYSVGVLVGVEPNDIVWILHVVRAQVDAAGLRRMIARTAAADKEQWGSRFRMNVIEQEPGASGKRDAERIRDEWFKGYRCKILPNQGSKEVRARGLSAVQLRTDCILADDSHLPAEDQWQDEFVDELALFPYGNNDDMVDGTTKGYNYLSTGGGGAGQVATPARPRG